MIASWREAMAILRRTDVRVGLTVVAVASVVTGVRPRAGLPGSSLLAVVTTDDRSWYVLVTSAAVLNAVSSAAFFVAGRDALAWASGRTRRHQLATRATAGAVLSLLCALIYGVGRVAAAAISAGVAEGSPVAVATPVPVAWPFAGRVVLLAVLAGIVGTFVGAAVRSVSGSAAATVVAFCSTLPVADLALVRLPALVSAQSYLPGGAMTTALESNGGLARASGLLELRSERPAWIGLVIVGLWCGLMWIATSVADQRRLARNPSALGRTLRAGGLSLAIVVVASAAVPTLARDALPWDLRPQWLHDRAHGTSSIDEVARFVATARSGRSPHPVVDLDDSVWRPLRDGDVSVASERQMPGPTSVTVRVDRPSSGRPWASYEFELRRGSGGWEVISVDATIA